MNRLTLHIGDRYFGVGLSKDFDSLPIEAQSSQLSLAHRMILNEIECGAIAELMKPTVEDKTEV
jgi:hypothetical protein